MATEKIIELDYGSNSWEDVLRHLSEKMVESGSVKSSYIDAVVEREKEFPTGLNTEGVGIAIPHTDAEHVIRDQIAVLRLKNPVTFLQMGDGEPVEAKLIFMLALTKPHEQLSMLQKLVMLIQGTVKVKQLLKLQDNSDVLTVLSDSGI
ncbi:PTS sugar transporter subunit IIA [Leuconostoc pseudomesenteroides]|uniref:PTS sugar transporter subunit IIA n=1 Tax=Leuconostoc pseudomesenteroides TaxID=33968 RepID=UPI0021A37CD3|nr:PTS sugar transporter subunit IIA [Leuconostoc pseudomesenteroides]MCT4379576.1 PTS sugar transporter subunit IIA [Leuconostoc pseudomesenteroides]